LFHPPTAQNKSVLPVKRKAKIAIIFSPRSGIS
jgi:hypothetical protein